MATTLANPVIALPQGQVQGEQRVSIYGDTYYSFEGIPYGQPPLGELRFRAPQPAEPWPGVRNCRRPASQPTQRSYVTGKIEGDENCLYMNVYIKKLRSDKPLPVMVWIYGGGFIVNGALPELYGPDYLMHEDVIVVHFNYRLCALGFLSLNDPSLNVPGNAGLKDQVLALKWVKQYIAHFNGDSNNITVFGESAGGASVHFMLATEQTRGLFHKAIVQSASIVSLWANTPQAEMGYRLAKQHGYDGPNSDREVLHFLQALEPSKLVDHALLTGVEHSNGLLFDFGPTVEPYVGADCVVPQKPLEMLKTAWGNGIPILVGGTSFEGLFMNLRLCALPHYMNMLAQEPDYLVPLEVREECSPDERRQFTTRLLEIHFDGQPPSVEKKFKYMDYYSFSIFWHGIQRGVLSRLASGTAAPTYYYRFDFDSPDFNHYRTKFCPNEAVRGVAHGDDLCYLFYSPDSRKLQPDTPEFKTIRRMVGMWTTFAKNGDPNCDAIAPAIWLPLDKSDPYKVLNIGERVEFIQLPEKAKLAVWDSMYKPEELY